MKDTELDGLREQASRGGWTNHMNTLILLDAIADLKAQLATAKQQGIDEGFAIQEAAIDQQIAQASSNDSWLRAQRDTAEQQVADLKAQIAQLKSGQASAEVNARLEEAKWWSGYHDGSWAPGCVRCERIAELEKQKAEKA